MRHFLISVFVLCFLQLGNIVAAHPPTDVDLTYDQGTKNLHIDVSHTSRNLQNHYIRKIVIDKNDIQTKEFVYAKQTTATMLIQDFPIEADSGDLIRVTAICRPAGRAEGTLVVP